MQYRSPDYTREAIIQAKLYIACEKAGLNCDLQYVINPSQQFIPEKYRKETSVFDLIVIMDYEIVAIVEVKTADASISSTENSEQIKRYKSYGVPVFILYSIYDIPYLVKRLLEVREEFLEFADLAKAKCFESDKQNEEKWNKKITVAFDWFDEIFPNYKFSNSYSLEILATGVKVLGLLDLLKLIDESKNSVEEFFSMLNNWIDYRKGGRERYLDTRKGTIQTISGYQDRQNRIDEKLE